MADLANKKKVDRQYNSLCISSNYYISGIEKRLRSYVLSKLGNIGKYKNQVETQVISSLKFKTKVLLKLVKN